MSEEEKVVASEKNNGNSSSANNNNANERTPTRSKRAQFKRSISEKFKLNKFNQDHHNNSADKKQPQIHKLIRQKTAVGKLKKAIAKNNYNIEDVDSDNQTPFHVACHEGQVDIMKYLLKKASNPNYLNLQDGFGFTPLHSAAIAKQYNACQYLLTQKNIDVTLKSKQGTTVLHYLARITGSEEEIQPWIELIKRILEKDDIDINHQNNAGETCLHFAMLKPNEMLINFLVSEGADINICNSSGQTCLHWAVRTNNVRLVNDLLDKFADPTVETSEGETAIDIAKLYKANDILDTLETYFETFINESNEDNGSSKKLEKMIREGYFQFFEERTNKWQWRWVTFTNKKLTIFKNASQTDVENTFDFFQTTADLGKPRKVNSETLYIFSLQQEGYERVNLLGSKVRSDIEELHDKIAACIIRNKRIEMLYEEITTLSTPRKRQRLQAKEAASEDGEKGTELIEKYVEDTIKNGDDNNKKLIELLFESDLKVIVSGISSIVTSDDQDEKIRPFLKLFMSQNKIFEVLEYSLYHTIALTATAQTMFRRKSFATKLLQLHMEDEGMDYLRKTVLNLVNDVTSYSHSLEIDPKKIRKGENTKHNLEKLFSIAQKFLDSVLSSGNLLPIVFRRSIRFAAETVDGFYPEMFYSVVGGFVFLRLIVPAVTMPQKYKIAQNKLPLESTRALLLISKMLQALSNGVEMDGSKQDYMQKLNPFLKKNKIHIHVFFDSVTNKQEITDLQQKYVENHKKAISFEDDTIQEHLTNIKEFLISKFKKVEEENENNNNNNNNNNENENEITNNNDNNNENNIGYNKIQIPILKFQDNNDENSEDEDDNVYILSRKHRSKSFTDLDSIKNIGEEDKSDRSSNSLDKNSNNTAKNKNTNSVIKKSKLKRSASAKKMSNLRQKPVKKQKKIISKLF